MAYRNNHGRKNRGSRKPGSAGKEPHAPVSLGKLTVIAEHNHEISGARLVLAEKAESSGSSYLVAWAAPWQSRLREYRVFSDRRRASTAFAAARKKEPPVTPSLCRDFQVSKVYQWEEDHIDRHSPANLTLPQMERVVKKISEDFNMVAPQVAYEKPEDRDKATSYYYSHLHKILMRHKRLSFVIHEVAHAVDMKENGNDWAHHGPSFVRTLIELAGKYQYWLDPKELEKSAEKAGILVAPKSALPARHKF